MSRDEVITAEGQPDKLDEKNLIFNEMEVAGHTAKVAYHFRDGKLVGATVAILSRIHEQDAQHVFADWKSALEAKYGKGGVDVERAGKQSFRVWGLWFTDRTQVGLLWQINGSTGTVGVDFTDKVWFNTQHRRAGF